MLRYGVLVRSGGMRNATVSGSLSVFQDIDCFKQVTHWWAQSSGAQTAAAFVSGQIDLTRDIWIRELTSRRLCGVRSLLACKRIADVDHLVEHCCRSLDFSVLGKTSDMVMVGVVNQATAETEYHQADTVNVYDLLKATCALPMLARSVTINGATYIDGGTLDPLPIATIMDQVDKLIILDNRPKYELDSQRRGIEQILFPRNTKLQQAFVQRPQRIAQSWELVRKLETAGRVLVIAPPVRVASRLCRNQNTIARAWQIGEQTALDHLPALRRFLAA